MATKTHQGPRADDTFGVMLGEPIIRIPLDSVHPKPRQPRTVFNKLEHEELTESVRLHGIKQPLEVTLRERLPGESQYAARHYDIVSGERRWRAAQAARLLDVPAIVREYKTEAEAYMASLIENVQRESLTAEDEVRAVERMRHEFGMGNAAIAAALGKGEGWITNRISAVNAPKFIRDLVSDFQQTISFVPVIRAAKTEELQRELVERVRTTPGISVRALTDYRNKRERELGLRDAPAAAQPVSTTQGTGIKAGGGITVLRPAAPEPAPTAELWAVEEGSEAGEPQVLAVQGVELRPAISQMEDDLRATAEGNRITPEQARDKYLQTQGVETVVLQPRAASVAADAALSALFAQPASDIEARLEQAERILAEWRRG